MMWIPPSEPVVDRHRFPHFKPERIIVEYDGPRVFTLRDAHGGLCLAYQCDELDDLWRFTVVPTSDRLVEHFVVGRLSVAEMLDQPWGWLVDADNDGVRRAWAIDPFTLPQSYQPISGVYLVEDHAERDLKVRTKSRLGAIA